MTNPTKKKSAKPKWRKSPPELIDLLGRALPNDPAVERRTMFGYPCAFIKGNMFAGLFGENIFVRLPEGERAGLVGKGEAAPFEPVPGRTMKEYVVLRGGACQAAALKAVISQSLAYARTIPAKKK